MWDIAQEITVDTVVQLSQAVTCSMKAEIARALEASPRLHDMLRDRYNIVKKRKVVKICALRHYLRVPYAAHRKALTHIVLSGHALAMDYMRSAGRDRPRVEAKWRLCHLCIASF